MKYTVPNEIKLVGGQFYYGETVHLIVDGKKIVRRVQYSSLDGLYVTINGVKYGKTDIQEKVEYSYYAIMYRNLRKSGVAVESTCYYAESEEAARKLLVTELNQKDRAFNINVLSIVKVDE